MILYKNRETGEDGGFCAGIFLDSVLSLEYHYRYLCALIADAGEIPAKDKEEKL